MISILKFSWLNFFLPHQNLKLRHLLLPCRFRYQPLDMNPSFCHSNDIQAIQVSVELFWFSAHYISSSSPIPSHQSKLGSLMSSLISRAQLVSGERLSGWEGLRPVLRSNVSQRNWTVRSEWEASQKLLSLKQGSRSVTDYAIDFQIAAADSSWTELTLCDAFYHGLSEQLKEELPSQNLLIGWRLREWGRSGQVFQASLHAAMKSPARTKPEIHRPPPSALWSTGTQAVGEDKIVIRRMTALF